ncbi:lipase 3-like [Coccinella septempunctata]|uniref:lipase 3-like n=1 Tax=Coccinella septempunctata TaxID=41139 RepID=UPI001D08B9F3|nr:lipase 3-like [Coccinella septempunctata]
MKLLLLLCLSVPSFCYGFSIPFFNSQKDPSDEYLHSMPYTKEEILEVRRKLNLSLVSDPDEYLSVPQLITKYGYPVEEHFTKTSDGYILRMHRIPPTKPGVTPNGEVVFLMHGLLMSSADWIILGPEKALAYYLADQGFDVWMGNARGNTYSRNHTRLKPHKSKFWKFSWHEIGTKDVPAMIDYTLKVTKKKALFHVGHSQGTTSFYVMCSELPKYNKKIIAHVSLAPIAFMKHAFSPIVRFASQLLVVPKTLLSIFGMNEILPHSALLTFLGNHFCAEGEKTEFMCRDVLFAVTGFDRAEFNDTLLPTFLGHTPAGSSARQFYHYAQLVKSGKFRQYDHFPFNSLHYGPLHPINPPSYNLKKVKAPVYLFYSNNDWLSHPKDVDNLCSKLGNCKSKTLVAENRFNHLDYVLGKHAKERIYTEVTEQVLENSLKEWRLRNSLTAEDEDDVLLEDGFDDDSASDEEYEDQDE